MIDTVYFSNLYLIFPDKIFKVIFIIFYFIIKNNSLFLKYIIFRIIQLLLLNT